MAITLLVAGDGLRRLGADPRGRRAVVHRCSAGSCDARREYAAPSRRGPDRAPRPGRRARVADGDLRGPRVDPRGRRCCSRSGHPAQLGRRRRGRRGPGASARGRRRAAPSPSAAAPSLPAGRRDRDRREHRVPRRTRSTAPGRQAVHDRVRQQGHGQPAQHRDQGRAGAVAVQRRDRHRARRSWSTMCRPFPPAPTRSSARSTRT